jgi:hypothetical protein
VVAPLLEGIGDRRQSRGVDAVALVLSFCVHAALVITTAVAVTRTLPSLPVPTMAVDLVSEAEYRAAVEPAAPSSAPLTASTVAGAPAPAEDAAPVPEHGEIEATTLLAESILADPANRVIRDTLPTLASFERVVQLCTIEAVEQIRLANPDSHPETVAAASFDNPYIEGGSLVATGAAYRSSRQWYHLSFTCTPRGDLLAVVAFSFETGALIPEDDWDAHNLNAEDRGD